MDALGREIETAYDRGIQVPGKEVHFLILVAFVASFGFMRLSTHMIRAQVSWWPGNVSTKGGTHVHHLVFGILAMMTFGYVGLALDPDSPWREVTAILFGIGMGLTMDEFALWLNLEDVYWSHKGRQSIDAVIVTTVLLVITLLGLQFWIDVFQAVLRFLGVGGDTLSGGESTAWLVSTQLVGVFGAVICFLKGKTITGLVGLFMPLVAVVGAVRLAKPGSRWARRYDGRKLDRSRHRFAAAPSPG